MLDRQRQAEGQMKLERQRQAEGQMKLERQRGRGTDEARETDRQRDRRS